MQNDAAFTGFWSAVNKLLTDRGSEPLPHTDAIELWAFAREQELLALFRSLRKRHCTALTCPSQEPAQ